MIKYDRDRDRSVVVYLSARDSRWYQFVYQFAHEYCHLLSNFARKQQHGDDILRDHQWFEEALCETASLYALRRLAVKWCDPTAEPMLREAAPKLAQYSRQLLAEPHRQLAAGTSFAAWYARNQQALERDPYMRESNELAATQLLPLFEAEPTRWAALAYLNPLNRAPGQSFADFLAAWSAASPPRLRALVAEIRTLFGMQPASGPSGPNDASRTRPLPGTATECGS
ncbi:MAG TPA: hypothetical protein VFR86_05415 [Burkholderiaceae bacterium]|nr:hypothetical protein [Burkholderiaceae bacterium]